MLWLHCSIRPNLLSYLSIHTVQYQSRIATPRPDLLCDREALEAHDPTIHGPRPHLFAPQDECTVRRTRLLDNSTAVPICAI